MERKLSYPVVYRKPNGEYYIHFCLNGKRIRLSNGKKINLPLYPNDYPKNQRKKKADELASLVYDYLLKNNYSFTEYSKPLSLDHFDEVIKSKLSEPLSPKYILTLDSLYKLLRDFMRQLYNICQIGKNHHLKLTTLLIEIKEINIQKSPGAIHNSKMDLKYLSPL